MSAVLSCKMPAGCLRACVFIVSVSACLCVCVSYNNDSITAKSLLEL